MTYSEIDSHWFVKQKERRIMKWIRKMKEFYSATTATKILNKIYLS